MSRETRSFFRRVLGDESGAAAVLVAVGIFALVGFGALSVDVGYLYSTQRELQASANAAAMAGARDIGVGGTPVATATSYSSVAGNKNANPNLTLASITPTLFCFNTGGACTINQTPTNAPNGANGIQVQEQATVPLFFGRIFGISTVQISATAVALAAGGVPHPLNVVFIVDTTGSMNGNDPVCGATRIVCALNGVKTLLGELWPCASNLASCGAAVNGNVVNPVDEAALMQFPGAQSIPANFGCAAAVTTVEYAGIKANTNASTATNSTTLHFAATPAFNTGVTALVTDATHLGFIPAGTTITSVTATTAVMSHTPTTTIASGDEIHVWPPVYQIVPLSSDYRNSDTANALNANSNLVKCANALTAPGGFATFYADAITAAQTALTNPANVRPGATNVIVLLTDGDSNADNSNHPDNMLASEINNQCKAAVTAAQNAAKAGTWVYSIAYGASSPSCSTDSAPYNSSCFTMSQIANVPGAAAGTYVNDPTKFYSDNANGCRSAKNPNINSINQIFQSIGFSLSTARLLPATCFGNAPPNWC
jgi:Flp pilus assembly protein TadG